MMRGLRDRVLASTVALGMAGCLLTAPAVAQVFYRPGPFAPPFAAPYPGPVGPGVYLYGPRAAPLPPTDISDILFDDYRFRQVGRPQFAGRVYVVDGIDRAGAIVRVYMDAFSGRLIDVDILSPARPAPRERHARLPTGPDGVHAVPSPPRRPAETRLPEVKPPAGGGAPSAPQPRSAARPPEAPAANPSTGAPQVVPMERQVRRVDPAETRVPPDADRAPPLARVTPPAAPMTEGLVAPGTPAAPVAPPAPAAAPGASTVAPAPLDDPSRPPAGPAAPPVPPVPLL
ncbi:MAG: hypothetical protein NTZ14_05535 [Hyphomicrobiales bacterium]|nr:hypothetical protein [Hyphomicrobiales bacterium]